MERLPHDPKNFRDIVEADLRRAARLVVKVQDEIDPQFRFATPEGDFHLPVMLPADLYGGFELPAAGGTQRQRA
jgi:hypothetical protein